MKLSIRFQHWVDGEWINGTGKIFVLVAILPFMGVPFIGGWWFIPSGVFALAFLTYVFRRWYRIMHRMMRPIDKIRDDWAAEHQSREYRLPGRKKR